jgi:hypothetical protein
LQLFVPRRLRKIHGIHHVDCVGIDKLRASADAGFGIMLAPNHCRPVDPETVNELCRQTGVLPFFLASRHLFMEGRFKTFMLRRLGAFSIYREGMDRQALKASVEILEQTSRPLVMFAEGYISRANDWLNPLQEGVSFVARSAAKSRAKMTPPSQVVVHPVALRYRYEGDVQKTIEPVLTEIESRLSWRPQKNLSLDARIAKLGQALLTLKEIEYLGQPQTGQVHERLHALIESLLAPLEKEWLKGESDAHAMVRVRKLRAAILPDMMQPELPEAERARRWDHLADLYLVQQLSCYPPDYVAANPTPDRLLETAERFEEGLTDVARIHPPLRATITVGDAIVVGTQRERGGEDSLITTIEQQLRTMLGVGHAASVPPQPSPG